jgi:DNA-binding PadR family transcriptional regulator
MNFPTPFPVLTKGDVLYIKQVLDEPLTVFTVSKKEIRILTALYYACVAEECRNAYAEMKQIREAIADLFEKKYSLGDISAFLTSLIERGYIIADNEEFNETVYCISDEGLTFLHTMQRKNPGYFFQSASPNVVGTIH